MRFLRISLLNSYLNFLSKNKKKSLAYINIGIFLCIFAISTSGISFFIENQISKKQTQLLYLQIEDKEYSRFISDYETYLNNVTTLLLFEDDYKVEKEYLAQSKIESQTLTDLDFFAPYIFSNVLSAKELLKNSEYLEYLNPNSEAMIELLAYMESLWSKEDVEPFKQSLNEVNESLIKFQKINIEKYRLKDFQDLDQIINEIINYKKNNLYNYNEELFSDYIAVKGFLYDLTHYVEDFLDFFSSLKASGEDNIKEINSEIISLSKKEKNYILGTFIFQFFIFLIIQIFEVNSLNFNLLQIGRKNAKKVK